MVYEAPSLNDYVVTAVTVPVFCALAWLVYWLWRGLVAAYGWVYERRDILRIVFIFGFIGVVVIAMAKGW